MTEEKRQIVIFKIGQERWGLEMLDIQEIIRLVEITTVPESPYMEGIINLRGKIIPIINMRKVMNIPEEPLSLNSRIVVVRADSGKGFVVDAVEDIIEVGKDQIESVQADMHIKEFVKGIIKIDEKLIILLDLNKILAMEGTKFTEDQQKNIPQLSAEAAPGIDETVRRVLHFRAMEIAKVPLRDYVEKKLNLIVFLLQNEWYGIEEAELREILKVNKIFFVPYADSYMEGIVNVRGEIIPVLNLADFLGLKKSSFMPQSRILIIDKDKFKVGLLVDKVHEIVEFDKDTLQILSDVVSQETSPFIKGEFHWQNKVVTLLDVDTVVKPNAQEPGLDYGIRR